MGISLSIASLIQPSSLLSVGASNSHQYLGGLNFSMASGLPSTMRAWQYSKYGGGAEGLTLVSH